MFYKMKMTKKVRLPFKVQIMKRRNRMKKKWREFLMKLDRNIRELN